MRVLVGYPGAALRVLGSLRTAYGGRDEAGALPAALHIDVVDARGEGEPTLLSLADFRRVHDPVHPVYLSLSGQGETLRNDALPDMVAHAVAGGSVVTVTTDGTLLDNAHARALLDAGLDVLKVSVDAASPDERVLRFVVGLLAMRDALRARGPRVVVRTVLARDTWHRVVPMIELCRTRLVGVEPEFRAALPSGHAAALAELRRGRSLAARHRMWRTVGSLDAAVGRLGRDRSHATWLDPWTRAFVGADGELYACRDHAVSGEGVGNVLARPFAEVWNGERMCAYRRTCRGRNATPHARP